MFIVISLLPLFPKTSTANFVVATVAFVLLILTLVMILRSLKEVVRVTDQIHAEVAAKKEQSS
jgi:cadmium resistance protein CadD (predicted permease)